MLISIIIPIYNVAEYVEACIRSAINQSYSDIEIIVVDDVGTDNSMEIVNRVISQLPTEKQIRIISHSSNRGLSAARNTGLEAARGEYVYFLDSDDYLTENAISSLVSPLKEYTPNCIIGNYRCSIDTGRYYPPLLLKEGLYRQPEIMRAYMNRCIYMMAQNKLYNRKYLLSQGLFFKEGLIHEDELFSFQFFSVCDSIYVVEEVVYIYVMRESSISNTVSMRNYEHWLTILQEMGKWIEKHSFLQRQDIFFYFEDLKNMCFRNLIRQKVDKAISHDYYCRLRDIHYIDPLISLLKKCSFRQRKRLMHYLLNKTAGYKVHHFLMK